MSAYYGSFNALIGMEANLYTNAFAMCTQKEKLEPRNHNSQNAQDVDKL